MAKPNSSKRGAFTLIELSVVLVIIGLIAGGIVVGKALLDAAKLKKDFATISEWNAAANTFRLKYNGLPGDLRNPASFGFFASTGNGDKKIGTYEYPYSGLRNNGGQAYREWYYVYHQLATAGLMPPLRDFATTQAISYLAGTGYPEMQAPQGGGNIHANSIGKGGILLVFEENNFVMGHYYRFGAHAMNSPSGIMFSDGFDTPTAAIVDEKYDDGIPTTGSIVIGPFLYQSVEDIYNPAANYNRGGVNATAQACTSSAMAYVATSSGRGCALRVKADF